MNIRLAAPEALALCLQCCTVSKILYSHQGFPKWLTGSGKGSTWRKELDKKWLKIMKEIVATYVIACQLPNGNRLQCHCSCQFENV